MARVLVLVLAAAVIVPTAVLGTGSAPASHLTRVDRIVEAFASEGISLTRARSRSVSAWQILVGRGGGSFRPVVNVFFPKRFQALYVSAAGTSGGGAQVVNPNSGLGVSGKRRLSVAVSRGTVVVEWSTNGPWRSDASRVRAALERLPASGSEPVRVSCFDLARALKRAKKGLVGIGRDHCSA